ncbi:hypothetical protein [Brucella tritici]|uniref:hypothetical protein n=1 Tax=Brucella tritici TaxID=94626 RepID=UPI001F295047|nr:hypothetical protein [Brucella tritici]
MPDQRRQAQEFCKARGWQVVIEFVDAGLTPLWLRSSGEQRPRNASPLMPWRQKWCGSCSALSTKATARAAPSASKRLPAT